jgi:DNA-binding IclR family transcriptional regulator
MRKQLDPSKGESAAPRSVIGRVVTILGLFDRDRLSIGAADIASALGISTASSYRYANDLLQAGLLAKSAGRYRLGPKIIELEYVIRTFDPVLQAGDGLMRALRDDTGCDVLLCNLYGDTIVNVLHIPGKRPVALTYTKGLPMPLFRGAQARVILAFTDYRRLRRLYERALDDADLRRDARAIGRDWAAFSGALREIRMQGWCLARGELDRGLTGISAPVLGADGRVLGSLVLVRDGLPMPRRERMLIERVRVAAAELSSRIAPLEAGAARRRG